MVNGNRNLKLCRIARLVTISIPNTFECYHDFSVSPVNGMSIGPIPAGVMWINNDDGNAHLFLPCIL